MYNETVDKSAVFGFMRELGVAKIEVEFSGGGDEGGVNGIRLTTRDGLVQRAQEVWGLNEDSSKQDKMIDKACAPVYAQYYSFAGEFYVNGIVTWDLDARTVKMDADEEIPQTQHVTEEW